MTSDSHAVAVGGLSSYSQTACPQDAHCKVKNIVTLWFKHASNTYGAPKGLCCHVPPLHTGFTFPGLHHKLAGHAQSKPGRKSSLQALHIFIETRTIHPCHMCTTGHEGTAQTVFPWAALNVNSTDIASRDEKECMHE